MISGGVCILIKKIYFWNTNQHQRPTHGIQNMAGPWKFRNFNSLIWNCIFFEIVIAECQNPINVLCVLMKECDKKILTNQNWSRTKRRLRITFISWSPNPPEKTSFVTVTLRYIIHTPTRAPCRRKDPLVNRYIRHPYTTPKFHKLYNTYTIMKFLPFKNHLHFVVPGMAICLAKPQKIYIVENGNFLLNKVFLFSSHSFCTHR